MSAPTGGLRAGDWVRVTSDGGSIIVGQAAHDLLGWGGSAILTINVESDSIGDVVPVRINVNFWDVRVTYRNMLRNQETK